MTNHNERLDEILNSLANSIEWCVNPETLSGATIDREREADAINQAKQAIFDWHNKQVDEIVGGIDSLELDDYDDTDPYQQGYMWAIGQAKTVVIEAVRNKLNESTDE